MRTAATSGSASAREQEREPERAELGERLEVEAVRVLHLLRARAVHEVVARVASGSAADERMRLHLQPRDVPELGAPVAREAEQPRVEIRSLPSAAT